MNNTNVTPSSTDGLDAFKHAFRRHAAGVVVVTSLTAEHEPVGFTATSVASLAAVPPLITFNMAQVASAWPSMTVGNTVVVHMLGARNRSVAERMAADHHLRFTADDWKIGPHGVPIIDDVTAWVAGPIVQVVPVHGNAVIVVQVESGALGEPDDALIYHERQYRIPGPSA